MHVEFGLYLELLLVGAIILAILYVNSIFLYKHNFSDRISMMLLFAVIMSLSEIGWVIFAGHVNQRMLIYIAIISYCISFMLFASLLNHYLIERFGFHPDKRRIMIFYRVPLLILILICFTTPLTRMLIWVDENGYVKYGPAFNIYFSCIVMTYLFVPSIIGFYYLTLGRNRLPADGEISITMFVFSGMTPVIYFLQLALVDSKHTTTSVAVTLALLYLITNESTHRVLDTQAKVEAVETELRIASKIQTDTLPPEAPEFVGYTNLNLRGSMITAKEVGGDFYDYFPIDNNRLCFLIADVSGKSTPAALFMMTTKTMIKDYALTKGSTSEIFTAVNSRLCENNKEGMFVTAWIGIIDTKTMTLQYTNAGHNYPYILREGQPCEIIKKNHGLFLGGMEFTQYKQGEIQLESGDRLLLYTDGVVEAHDCSGGLYGSERLERILNSTRDCTGEEVLKRVLNDVNDFAAGVPQFDDITMIIMTVK